MPESGFTIKIVRKKQYGAIPLKSAKDDTSGEYSVAEVSVKGIMNATSPEENVLIQPFDVITVPKAELIYVVGTVKRSGGFTLAERENVTVLQALSMAEGFGPQPADKPCKMALVQIGSCDDFGRGRCFDPSTDQAANAACQIS